MFCLEIRKTPITFILQSVILLNCNLGENVATLCRSSLMHSIQSFEFDENLILAIRFTNGQLHFVGFEEYVDLLNQNVLRTDSI